MLLFVLIWVRFTVEMGTKDSIGRFDAEDADEEDEEETGI